MKLGIQEKLTKYEIKQKALMDERSNVLSPGWWESKRGGAIGIAIARLGNTIGKRLLSKEVRPWPGAGKYGGRSEIPKAQMVARGAALLEIALEWSEYNRQLYLPVVEAFKTTEARAIWDRVAWQAKENPKRYHALMRAVYSAAPLDEMPHGVAGMFASDLLGFLGNPQDLPSLIGSTDRFIFECFNKREDIDFNTPKVVANPETGLTWAVWTRAFADAHNLDLDALGRQVPGSVADIFGKKPTTEAERQRKTHVREDHKRFGIGLVHDEAWLRDAEIWYIAKVDPGNFAAVRNLLQKYDNPKISHIIAPYNKAAGYATSH